MPKTQKLSSGCVGYVCGGDSNPKSIDISKVGLGPLIITADMGHCALKVLRELKESGDPRVFFPAMIGYLERELCTFCEGQGWSIGNMGESADNCPACDGTGLKKIWKHRHRWGKWAEVPGMDGLKERRCCRTAYCGAAKYNRKDPFGFKRSKI